MSKMCLAEYERLATHLRDTRCDSHSPFITFMNPFHLQNWTMPVWEYALLTGTVVLLTHAFLRYRRYGDSTNIVVWFGSALCILIFEPIVYFSQYLGLYDKMGLLFIWNQFSVQLLYDRMPLHGVSMYSSFFYLAYCLVKRTGIFEKYGKLVGALTVSFGVICLYEPAEHVGPQLKWWVWNTHVSTASPAFGIIPMLNMLVFNIVMPVTVVLVAYRFESLRMGGWKILRNIGIAAASLWPATFLVMALPTLLHLLGMNLAALRATETIVLLIAITCVALYALFGAYRARRANPDLVSAELQRDYVPLICSVASFVMLTAFWIAALPGYFAAKDGLSPDGGQISSLPVAVITGSFGVLLVIMSYLANTPRHRHVRAPVLDREPVVA